MIRFPLMYSNPIQVLDYVVVLIRRINRHGAIASRAKFESLIKEVFCRKKWGVRVRVRTRARVSLARVQDIRGLFACTGRHAGISRAHVGCALKAPIG